MRFWKQSARDTRGAEIAEAAIVLPLVFMLLLGIYWFGRAYNIYATITHAAREGARAATAPTSATFGNTPLDAGPGRDPGIRRCLQASKLNPSSSDPVDAQSGAERLHHSGAGDYVRGDWWRKPADLLPVECADQRADRTDRLPAEFRSVSNIRTSSICHLLRLNNQLIQLKANVQTTGEN